MAKHFVIQQPGIVVHCPPDRDTWLTLRQRDVTASQVGALLGLHEYVTQLELWGEKSRWMPELGKASQNGVLLRGELLEDDALELLSRANPTWRLHRNVIGQGGIYLQDTVHRLGGTPDGFAEIADTEVAVIEVKTTDWMTFQSKWGGRDNPEPPLWIALQAMLNAHLAGRACAYIACMVVGRTLDLHTMRVDVIPDLIAKLQRLSLAFWQSVDSGKPPDPDYDRDAAMISLMLPYDTGTEVDLSSDNEFVDACARYSALKAEIAESEDEAKRHASLIKHRLGEHSTAIAGPYRVSNKRIERKAYVVQATAYRKLTVKESGS